MISVVVPIFNEEANLPELRRRMAAALDRTGGAWELILVDDGSRDASDRLIRQYHAEDPRIKLITLSRNFGHQAALTAGVRNARGDCVVLSDGDLQDPPEVIPEMVAKWREGCQVVLGERRSRAEGGARGLGFRLFYPLLRRLTELPDAADAGVFGLMDRVVVDEFNKLREHNRFIPGLRSWLGFRQASVLYDRQERSAGAPKQTLRRLVRYASDGLISFSYVPLHAVTWLGVLISVVSFLTGLGYLAAFYLQTDPPPRGFTTIILCVLFLGGVQLISVGILGAYVGRIYEEIKQRPLYVVAGRVGFGDAEPRDSTGNGRAGADGARALADLPN